MKFINFFIEKSNTCPACGEWSDVYDIGNDKYECGNCGKKWKF